MEKFDIAVVVVGDFKYLRKNFSTFMSNLNNKGKFKGDVLVLTSYLTPTFLMSSIWKNKNVKVLRFKKISFSQETKKRYLNLNTNGQPNRFKTKNFQWFKLNLFHEKLKKWKFVLYLDINLTIHKDINPIFDIKPENILLKCDSYPNYKNTLRSQFDLSQEESKILEKKFDLNDSRYFQTGLMYLNTQIIQSKMISEILEYANLYPISITNEQGILNLYFQDNKYLANELPEFINNDVIYFYWMLKNQDVIITKQLVEKYK